MTRRQRLVQIASGRSEQWQAKMVVANLPSAMLANDFILSLGLIANAAILTAYESNLRYVESLDVAKNSASNV